MSNLKSDVWDVRSRQKWKKNWVTSTNNPWGPKLGYNDQQSVGTVVRSLSHTAAPGLKPLRLPRRGRYQTGSLRAEGSGSVGGISGPGHLIFTFILRSDIFFLKFLWDRTSIFFLCFWDRTSHSALLHRPGPVSSEFQIGHLPNLRSDNEWSPISKWRHVQPQKRWK